MSDLIKAHKLKDRGIRYVQSELRKGNVFEISFIPKKFAVIGEVLKIKKGDKWDDGWVVQSVGAEVDESFLDGMRNAWKHHADVSDI